MKNIPEKETIDAIAELFKAFGDPTRLEILSLLLQQERMALARVENQYFLEVFANNDAYLYLIPASYNAVFDEVAKAYEDAMWRFMGALG